MLLQDLLQSESLTTAAPRLRRGAAVYAPTFFAPYVLAGLIAAEGGGRLVVAPDAEAAAALAAELAVYLEREVPVLPARGVLYGADVAPAPHVVGQRQQALAALGAGGVVVADAVAALERFLPLDLQPEPLRLVVGEETPFDLTVERLVALGYGRVEQVRGRGEFAVRGGLVDVYPSIGEPLRVEFWGDEVERLRTFSVYSQRTAAEVAEATAYAAFEADTAGDDFQGAVRQVEAAWEEEGRDETPDDSVRRAEVRALAGLAGRFTTLAECAAAAGVSLIVLRPDETWRVLADFAAEVDLVFGPATRDRGVAGAGDATGRRCRCRRFHAEPGLSSRAR
ncbi:MAG: hypothetical protein V2J16_03920, partial [Thermoleophilia bacterium]|nr:hypothetical protein [Thermoleophilia bacterium]